MTVRIGNDSIQHSCLNELYLTTHVILPTALQFNYPYLHIGGHDEFNHGCLWGPRFGTLVANGFVCVMSLAVAEEVVDDHADDREQEDNEGPDDLAGNGAVRLEDFD